MSVWLCIPSARENGGTAHLWKKRGYKVALWRDVGGPIDSADYVHVGTYPGYAKAVNHLAAHVLAADSECNWIVTGGDDTEPDMNYTPDEIAAQCTEFFRGTFGVMQPTGDRFANGSIDRIAGSPWLGREWCQRANQGAGPLYPEFTHMFVDEALQHAALKCNAFFQRRDLIHLHHHFMRATLDLNSKTNNSPVPPHLRMWTSRQHWNKSKAIFERLKRDNFAACMPLEAAHV